MHAVSVTVHDLALDSNTIILTPWGSQPSRLYKERPTLRHQPLAGTARSLPAMSLRAMSLLLGEKAVVRHAQEQLREGPTRNGRERTQKEPGQLFELLQAHG